MKAMLWLAIAVVSAVTAVILARRKNRSTVIWPVASFVFPLALLPLFALAPLAEKNTQELDRKALIATGIVTLIVGGFLLRYGTLRPCEMYKGDLARALIDEGKPPLAADMASELIFGYFIDFLSPFDCLEGIVDLHLNGYRPERLPEQMEQNIRDSFEDIKIE